MRFSLERTTPTPTLPQLGGGRTCASYAIASTRCTQLPLGAKPLQCPPICQCVSGDFHDARSPLRHPVRAGAIGPVTARNRFYQVPHCNGMGRSPRPRRHARHQGGGRLGGGLDRGDRNPSDRDVSPFHEVRLWDDDDIPSGAIDAVHMHGALAGVELFHNGCRPPTAQPRGAARAVHQMTRYDPVQARAMDKEDIRNFRRWHRQAAIRASRQASISSMSMPVMT